MNKNKLLSILFMIAGLCFTAGTINHIINTKESIISSVLLAAGCFCFSYVFSKQNKK